MARHLIVGDGTALARAASGLVNDGGVSVEKMSASGPTELVLGDTPANAPQIRIVGGGTDGKSYVSAKAQTTTLLPVATAAATVGGKELDIKFVFRNGKGKQEIFSFATTIVASSVIADSGQAIIDAFNALTDVPDWLNPTATLSTATVTFTGAKRGDTAQSGNTWDYEPVVFSTHIGSNPVLRLIRL